MSARTCLLCGKALSRIWSGSSEDFCSREHRNQYRLRQGMDRLRESTRVSNVMRRRELPMAVAQPVLPAGSGARVAAAPRIGSARRPDMPVRPARLPRLDAGMQPESSWLAVAHAAGYDAKPRDYRMLRQQPRRTAPLLLQSRIASPGSRMGDPETRHAPLAPAAKKGRALKVSMGAGFRLPSIPRHQYGSRSIAAALLVWTDATHRPLIRENPPQPRAFGVATTRVAILELKSRRTILLGFQWPGPRTASIAVRTGDQQPRESAAPLGRGDLPPVPAPFRPAIPAAGLAAGFARSAVRPTAARAEFRIATVPFDSQYLTASSPTQEHTIQ